MTCSCGARYKDFRSTDDSGRVLTFAKVRSMMFNQPDSKREGWWRQKRRRSVLGYWHELKLMQWRMFHGYCESVTCCGRAA